MQRVALVKAPIAARPSRNGNALLSRDSLASPTLSRSAARALSFARRRSERDDVNDLFNYRATRKAPCARRSVWLQFTLKKRTLFRKKNLTLLEADSNQIRSGIYDFVAYF